MRKKDADKIDAYYYITNITNMDVCTSKVRKRFLLSLHNIWDNIWGPVGLIEHSRTETPGRCRETHSASKRALQKRALPSHEPGGASSMAVTRVLSHNLL